jgi:hypothetical protein
MSELSVLIVDGESPFCTAVVACLAAARVRVHVLSRTPWPPVRVSRHVASFQQLDPHAKPAAGGILAAASRARADICLAIDEEAIRKFADDWKPVAEVLPVAPIPPLRSFDITADKGAFAGFLADSGLPHPPTLSCDSEDALAQAIEELPHPFLLKPRRGGNGAGIVRCQTQDDLRAHARRHPEIFGRYLIQSEFQGSDIDCSVICDRGHVLAHTIQRPLVSSHSFKPSGAIEFVHDDAVLDVVRRLMASLEWTGVAHVDLRRNDAGEVTIVEVNPRFWGSLIGSFHAGVNFPVLSVLAGLSRSLPATLFQSCRYIAGGAALRAWMDAISGVSHMPFGLAQTAWMQILHDPAPHLLALWL